MGHVISQNGRAAAQGYVMPTYTCVTAASNHQFFQSTLPRAQYVYIYNLLPLYDPATSTPSLIHSPYLPSVARVRAFTLGEIHRRPPPHLARARMHQSAGLNSDGPALGIYALSIVRICAHMRVRTYIQWERERARVHPRAFINRPKSPGVPQLLRDCEGAGGREVLYRWRGIYDGWLWGCESG